MLYMSTPPPKKGPIPSMRAPRTDYTINRTTAAINRGIINSPSIQWGR